MSHMMNGVSNHHMGPSGGRSSGQLSVQERLGPRKLINRTEYVRLIEQALHRLGHSDVAQLLEQQSGIQMQPPEATQFQHHILSGQWREALALLPALTQHEEVLKDAKFLILQQQYLEALEQQDFACALACLRNEMAPLGVQQQQLHHLAGLLLCPAGAEKADRAVWLGGGAAHRPHLLALLQSKLPPSLMLPDARLEQLVQQALEAQVARCPYHNALEARLSLLSDYQAGVECLPTSTVQVLEQHGDEVWHSAWSHGGTMLASASKDKSAIIWTVRGGGGAGAAPSSAQAPQLAPVHVLGAHPHAVAFLAWSPDDRLLLTCSEETVRLWDVATGQLLHTFGQHKDAVNSVVWLPDSARFISGGADKLLVLWDAASGQELQRWKRSYRVQDLAIGPGGCVLAVACSDRSVRLLRLADQKEAALTAPAPITSMALSRDCRQLLVALQSGSLQLWDIGSAMQPYPQALDIGPDPLDALPAAPLAEFRPSAEAKPSGRYVLRCGFGGSDCNFVVHGSEDGQVYVWHRDSVELLLKLQGHAGTVNSVAWNPANPYMLVSTGDDRTLRVWLAAAALQHAGGRSSGLPLLRAAAAAAAAQGGGSSGVGGPPPAAVGAAALQQQA